MEIYETLIFYIKDLILIPFRCCFNQFPPQSFPDYHPILYCDSIILNQIYSFIYLFFILFIYSTCYFPNIEFHYWLKQKNNFQMKELMNTQNKRKGLYISLLILNFLCRFPSDILLIFHVLIKLNRISKWK